MKKGHPNSISGILVLSLTFLLHFTAPVFAQGTPAGAKQEAVAPPVAPVSATISPTAPVAAGDPAIGKSLFNANCAACHKLDAKMTGPALRNVADRHDRQWIYKWVHNSSEMIKAGDAAAVKLFEENNKAVMTAFPQLSTTDIDNIMAYTSMPAEAAVKPAGGQGGDQASNGGGSGVSNTVVLSALAVVMAILVVMLFMVNRVLSRIAKQNGIQPAYKEPTLPIWKAYARNQFLVLVTAILLLLASGYFVYGYLMQIGVDQGYMPVQPIHFSHKIHAGDNGVDCKYCHSSARVSKNAGIPSLNVCMNCHKTISEFQGDKDSTYVEYSKEYYTGEIQKLYDAVGWDKTAQKYTGEQHPVKWVRIHNLPDFAYFNHSQHVSVAGIECQKCHGEVQTFEVQRQFAPLTMGWCVNCHRETDVKMEGNKYYEKIHEELSKKYGVEKLTAAQMGGLECGKCHY